MLGDQFHHYEIQTGGIRYENFVPRLFSRILARSAFICLWILWVAVGRLGQETEARSKTTYSNHPTRLVVQNRLETLKLSLLCKATITRCDLSPRFFCIDARLLCEFESDKI